MPSSHPSLSRRSFLVTALAGGTAAVAMPAALAVDQASVFRDAAAEFAVPAKLLAAFSYGQTRWVDHGGHPSRSLGYGPMHLIDGAAVAAQRAAEGKSPASAVDTLSRAAAASGIAARTRSMTVAMPSSVAASADTGTTDSPCCASGATCSSRFSCDRLTATTVAPASAARRGIVVPMPPPPAPETTTIRPSRLSDTPAVISLVRTNNVTLHTAEHYSAALMWPSRPVGPQLRRYCLD